MINRTVLVGRLTQDPELRHVGDGTAVANFTLAVDRSAKKDESGEKPVDFIRCVAWRQSAEFLSNYGSKGRVVGVDGRIQVRQWTDDDEQKHTMTEVVAERVQLLDRKPADTNTEEKIDVGLPEEDNADTAMPF